MEWIDGYSESGGAAGTNATVGSQDVGVAEGRIELAASRELMSDVRLTGRGGYLARTSTGDDSVDVTLFDMTEDVPTYDDDASSFYAGGDLVILLPGMAALQLGGNAFFGGDGMFGYEATASVDARF
jgi:hypothetical protein